MEERAPYGLPQANPPDLSAALVVALTRLGFEVKHEDTGVMSLVLADWVDDNERRFYLTYTHYHPGYAGHIGYVRVQLLRPCNILSECLLSDTHVRQVSEVRRMLLNNVLYKTARLNALRAGTLAPAA